MPATTNSTRDFLSVNDASRCQRYYVSYSPSLNLYEMDLDSNRVVIQSDTQLNKITT